MNVSRFAYLPLALLLSTMAYTMDTEKKDATKDVVAPTVVLTHQQSQVMQPEQAVEKDKNNPSVVASTPVPAVQSKNLGVSTWLKDSLYGQSVMVAHEISKDKFDKTIPANHRRLSKALEQETTVESPENLKQLKEILENCQIKKIGVDEVAVLQLLRQYSNTIRTKEEAQLKDEATTALQNADKARSELVTTISKAIVSGIEQAKEIDKKLTEELDSIHKKHDDVILLATQVKRLTRGVNDHIPADGYDSDTESKYDRPFNAHKLGLDTLTATNHKLNKRVADNFEILKGSVEVADKQTITKS